MPAALKYNRMMPRSCAHPRSGDAGYSQLRAPGARETRKQHAPRTAGPSRGPPRRRECGRTSQGRGTPAGWPLGGNNWELEGNMKSASRSESATHGHHRRNLVPTANGKKRERQTPRNSASPGAAHRSWVNAAGPPRAAARPRGGWWGAQWAKTEP